MESMESMESMERAERMESAEHTAIFERLALTIRSFSVTLIVRVAVIGLSAAIGLGVLGGCASDQGESEDYSVSGESGTEQAVAENTETMSDDGAENTETGSVFEGERSESTSDDEEESGDLLALDETYDFVRKGTRLILRYDAAGNAFLGTVQNTTEGVLNRVRVEVHLSNGTELGPTTPVDLAPGESVDVSLAATDEPFTGWTPHAEVGEGEHGRGSEGGEGGGEHGSGGEGGDEHGSGGDGSREHGGGGEGGESGEGGEHRSDGDGDGGEEHGSGS